jgi:membrane protease subunit HflK
MKYYGQGGRERPREQWARPSTPINWSLVPIVLVVIVLLAWVVLGGPAFTVAPHEEGVVLTFGRFSRTTQPGLHFKWPWPVQTVEKVPVAEVKRLEIGFRSRETQMQTPTQRAFIEDEARMLTGDENVVDASMVVQYRVNNSLDYLFNFEPEGPASVEGTLQDVGEAALRQAVGDHPIDDVLTVGKTEIQNEVQDIMQRVADDYRMGISITAVQLQDVQPPERVAQAFLDVATAREEREQKINEAQAYRNAQLPEAEGRAARLLQEAEGYKQARIAEAQGTVDRFKAIAEQYRLAPDVTRARLFLDTMNELLPKVRLRVIDESMGVVNVNQLGAAIATPPRPAAPARPTQSAAPQRSQEGQ